MNKDNRWSRNDDKIVKNHFDGVRVGDDVLFNSIKNIVYRFTYFNKFGKYGGERDDLAQDVLLKIYLNLHKYDPKYSFGTWVNVILRNTIIDRVRLVKLDVDSLDVVADHHGEFSFIDTSHNPENILIIKEWKDLIKKMLIHPVLNDYESKILKMRCVDDFSYQEIADVLGISLGNVKRRLFTCRAKLRGLNMKYDGIIKL